MTQTVTGIWSDDSFFTGISCKRVGEMVNYYCMRQFFAWL